MNQRIGFLSRRCSSVRSVFPSAAAVLQRAGRAFLLTILTALPATLNLYADPVTPSIVFEQNAVVVTDVTPNAQVIIFGIEREVRGFGWHTANVSVASQSDASGVARLDLQRAISSSSIYAAVDFVTGQYAIASPQGQPPKAVPIGAFRMNDTVADEVKRYETFDFDRQWVQAICVRPGEGAWRVSLMDDSSGDSSPLRGTMQMAAPQMQAIAGEASSPVKFRPHDILIAIDPYEMDVIALAVSE